MVIWPKAVSRGDEGWEKACALLQVLALDPRMPLSRGFQKQRNFFESADDFLVRPNIYVDRKLVPAPYHSYCIRFNVSASVLGSIPIDDCEQLDEFRRAVSAALVGELTVAEQKRWAADSEFRRCCAAKDPLADAFTKTGAGEGRKADRYYHEVREAIEAPRRFTDYWHASWSEHGEVLEGLIRLGSAMATASPV